jgi:hypothetical protein
MGAPACAAPIADKDDAGSEFPLLQFREFDPRRRQVPREFLMFRIAQAGRKLAALIRAFPENLRPRHVLPQPGYSFATHEPLGGWTARCTGRCSWRRDTADRRSGRTAVLWGRAAGRHPWNALTAWTFHDLLPLATIEVSQLPSFKIATAVYDACGRRTASRGGTSEPRYAAPDRGWNRPE